MTVQGKVAIVTGSTQGIGRGIARRFAAEGADVVVVGRNETNGQAVVEELHGLGARAIYVRTDVSRAGDVERMGIERAPVLEYAPDADPESRFKQTEAGLEISVMRAQRIYNNRSWPNAVVIRLKNVIQVK